MPPNKNNCCTLEITMILAIFKSLNKGADANIPITFAILFAPNEYDANAPTTQTDATPSATLQDGNNPTIVTDVFTQQVLPSV